MTLKARIAKIEAAALPGGSPAWIVEGREPTFIEWFLWVSAHGITLEDLILASMDQPSPNSAKLAKLEGMVFA